MHHRNNKANIAEFNLIVPKMEQCRLAMFFMQIFNHHIKQKHRQTCLSSSFF